MTVAEEVNCRKCGGKLQKGTMKIGSHEMPVLDCPKFGSRYVTGEEITSLEKKVKKKL